MELIQHSIIVWWQNRLLNVLSASGSKSVWNELQPSNYPAWRSTHWPLSPAAWSHFQYF